MAAFFYSPARYDATPTITAKAAAFGIPTTTNNIGGISLKFLDGESGVLLPPSSTPKAYVKVFNRFIQNPEMYVILHSSTRDRYERELYWHTAGKNIVHILRDVIEVNRLNKGGLIK